MVAIGGTADIVQHWHEMARSRMTQSGHCRPLSKSQFKSIRCPPWGLHEASRVPRSFGRRDCVAARRTGAAEHCAGDWVVFIQPATARRFEGRKLRGTQIQSPPSHALCHRDHASSYVVQLRASVFSVSASALGRLDGRERIGSAARLPSMPRSSSW
jgi:hypothetical protein